MENFVGIGLRRDIAEEIIDKDILHPSFIEFAPENWIDMGGYYGKILKKATEKYPVTSHGLSLSLGSPEPLDKGFLKKIKTFLKDYNIQIFSEHLSYTKVGNAHLYDLLPIPFREDAVKHVAGRIKEVQDFLGMEIAIENVSYYTPVAAEMEEWEFINAIVEESGCNLLLDVNNVYVNAFNHGYDADEFISKLPLHRVAYIHMAGHEKISGELIIDTHGQDIIDPVYELFERSIRKLDPVPVLLERDYNFGDLPNLQRELENLDAICTKIWEDKHVFA